MHCENVSQLVEKDEFFNHILQEIKGGVEISISDVESVESLQSALNDSSTVIRQTVSKKNDEIMDLISTYNRLLAVHFMELN